MEKCFTVKKEILFFLMKNHNGYTDHSLDYYLKNAAS